MHGVLAPIPFYVHDALRIWMKSFVVRIRTSTHVCCAVHYLCLNIVRAVAVPEEVDMHIMDPGDMSRS
jgi:hypothetical protein